MNILALDLGVRTGFAIGTAGHGLMPRSGARILKKPSEHRSVAFSNLIAWLQDTLHTERPDLVVREAPLALQAFRTLNNAAFTVRVTHGLHGIVEGMCARFAIRCEEAADATVRKHFIGKANAGNRQATKAAVIQRCHVLGYMPKDASDDNRADACALFDFAAATYGNRRARELHLFGENAA